MTITPVERTVLPPDTSLDSLVELFEHDRDRPDRQHAELVGPNGERVALPDEVHEVLSQVVTAMAQGNAVTIAPHHQTLTTQEAANILDVSRPTLVRLLENGEIPYEQPGRHRRLLLRDVLEYQERRRHERHRSLDALVDVSEEAGAYEKTTEPRKTR